MTILQVLLAIQLLGILIMVHEFGHFAVARLCGIAVKEFSLGFGPVIWQHKSKESDTTFSIRPIPMGGYCMFYGDTDDDPNGSTKDDPRNYNKAPVWKRMLSVLAGPGMNFVLAFVVAIALMGVYGAVATTPVVQEVEAGMPAASRAGQVRYFCPGQPDRSGKRYRAGREQRHRRGRFLRPGGNHRSPGRSGADLHRDSPVRQRTGTLPGGRDHRSGL